MIKELRLRLKDDGRSMKWFYLKYIKKQTGLTYSGFASQLNGYAPLSEISQKNIKKYMDV